MENATIERVYGGIAYLNGAFSKSDFFSRLEAFLQEMFGPSRFSFLVPLHRRSQLQLVFSNHPDCPRFQGEPPEASCPSLEALLKKRTDFRPAPGQGPLALGVGSRALPVYLAKRIGDGGSRAGWVAFHDPAPLGQGDQEVFGLEPVVFDHISQTYYRLDERETLQRRLDLSEAKLAAISGLGELIGNLDVDVLLTKLMELSLFIASAQVGSVILLREGGIESRVEWGLPLEIALKLSYRGGPSILEQVLRTGMPELIPDFHDPERFQGVPDLRVDSYLCIPLLTKGKLLGAINLINSADHAGFNQIDRESILTISGLAATALENAILHRDSLEKERITANLRIAQAIQNRMYPKERPLVPGYEMAWINMSCDETGGDYFDFIPLDDDNLAVVIGDVAGHGIGAALLMATGRANLRALFSLRRGIREVVTAMDALMERDMDVEKFMTLFVGKIDHRRNLLTYVNAGHDHPLLFRSREGTVSELVSTGLPLGILGASARHEEVDPIAIEKNDVLLLLTDGVWEEANASGDRFGKDRLTALFARTAHASPGEIVETIRKEVFAFSNGPERKDDFTMVAVKRVD